MSAKDVKDASAGVLKDLKRFQGQKEEDLRRYMVSGRALMALDASGCRTLELTLLSN